ncbi:MAG: hypothetical protein KA384_02865 [Leptotrichiaceae bacterium]|nr:hypothetical protein [Leptotrichiaceae bacterium]MBP7739192.1 hypothetical protein [Leptotrichiaceae bacterium]MBP9629654.1 hypothetical protein [Leptotrichiaceae bacterium]
MKNELQIFKNDKFGEIEILIENGKEYFPATEIAKILGYSNPHDAIIRHCKKEGLVIHEGVLNAGLGEQIVSKKYIDEGNLYRLIIKSNLPQAEIFERWVFDEVIPSIRKIGSYTVKSQQTESQKKRLEIMDRNSRARMSKEFSKLALQMDNPKFKEVLKTYAANTLAGENILPLPKLEQKTYTATEIGNILGISSNMVGRLANEYNIKTDKYGYFAFDKAKGHNKQVESFRYFEHAIDKFRNILNKRGA